jgi:catechol 2,3-dioxygenase-like lactoylglutathione lyase family enzyme
MTKKPGFAHINLNVHNLERSVQFYKRVFCMTEVYVSEGEIELDARRERICQVVLTCPGTQNLLALTYVPSFSVGPGGVNHLGFILEADGELGSMLREVERCGGKIRKQGHREYGGVSEQFAYVEDPDGYVIELATQAILYRYLSDKDSL